VPFCSAIGGCRALSSLLQKAAGKDDCADMVVTISRTETMTGETVVIDAERTFH
jgi:3-oxoacyl-[acyl-carrier protein] reductase